MKPREGYSTILIKKNLEEFGAGIKSRKGEEYLELKDDKTPIYTSNGMINEENMQKITKTISKETGKKEEEIYASLIKKPDFYLPRKSTLEQVLNKVIVVLLVGLVILILSQTKLLTGFAISNIPNPISNAGIFICILGLVFLLFYKFKRK